MDLNDTSRVRDTNRAAWNADRYQAWCDAYGEPRVAAHKIVADPAHVLRRLICHLGEVNGRRVCSVQGSHGRVAAALAKLGAEVTVIDFAEENRRYALALAEACGVTIDYRVCDVMEAGGLGLSGDFDALVMELGVVHYHQDIGRFFSVMRELAKSGGLLVLNEFHPVQRKLFWDAADGDYFRAELIVADVPDPTGEGRRLGECAYRMWTLGEIVTAAVRAGFILEKLEEHPDWDNPRLPGTFTLVARAP